MVFSSSATIYGQLENLPCVEDFQLVALNPYGATKSLLASLKKLLEYSEGRARLENCFIKTLQPVGAHESGKIGEDPKGIPNSLMPYIQQVAVGRLLELNV